MQACKRDEVFPVQPEIAFENFIPSYSGTGSLDSLKMEISFTDGDGDLGLGQADTFPPFNIKSEYYYNFILKYFEIKNGIASEKKLNATLNARIPFIPPQNGSKYLKGKINIILALDPFAGKKDTIFYKAFVYDRALHKSNEITTPAIVLNP